MVDFIGIRRVQELVADLGPAPFIAGLAREIEADYRRWGEFSKSPRHATHSEVGVIELMPACDGRQYAFKYVNGHPKNTAKGLLTVTAFGMLADVETGYPLMLSEMTLTTALRTAATSAVAARLMARPGSRVMALIGNGSQAEFQSIAFHDCSASASCGCTTPIRRRATSWRQTWRSPLSPACAWCAAARRPRRCAARIS